MSNTDSGNKSGNYLNQYNRTPTEIIFGNTVIIVVEQGQNISLGKSYKMKNNENVTVVYLSAFAPTCMPVSEGMARLS